MLVLAAPIVVTQLLQVLYNLVDTFRVGRLCQDAVTALSSSVPPVFVLVSLGGLTPAVVTAFPHHLDGGRFARPWFAPGSWADGTVADPDATPATPAD